MSDLRRSIARDLALVFCAAWGIRLVWTLLIPPWTSPDEPDHFTYVSHLVEQGRIPRTDADYKRLPEYSHEMLESWTRTALPSISGLGAGVGGTLAHLPVQHDYLAARNQNGSHERRISAAGGRASHYSPLYYSFVGLFYRAAYDAPFLTRLYAVRAGSALLGALTCCFAYLFAFELRRKRSWGRALGLAMAFMPMHVFITASANNDSAMVLGSTALSWLGARALMQPTVTPLVAGALGISSGLTLVSKPTSAPVVVIVGLVVLVRAFPLLRAPWRFVRAKGAALACFTGGLLATNGLWMTYKILSARTATATNTTEGEVMSTALRDSHHSISAYANYLVAVGSDYHKWLLIKTYWACFGWLEVYLPESTYDALIVVYIVAFIGLIVRLVLREAERRESLLSLSLVLFHCIVMFVVADYLLSFALKGTGVGLQGRYFFPTLAPMLMLLIAGLGAWVDDHPVFLRLAPLAMIAFHLQSLSTLLSFFYGISFL